MGNDVMPVKTVLLLEDNSTVMSLLRLILRDYNLVETTSAEEALRQFSQHQRNIDLLIADVTLPIDSGVRLAGVYSEDRDNPRLIP
jgi:two-component system, OmpR family, response regulator